MEVAKLMQDNSFLLLILGEEKNSSLSDGWNGMISGRCSRKGKEKRRGKKTGCFQCYIYDTNKEIKKQKHTNVYMYVLGFTGLLGFLLLPVSRVHYVCIPHASVRIENLPFPPLLKKDEGGDARITFGMELRWTIFVFPCVEYIDKRRTAMWLHMKNS